MRGNSADSRRTGTATTTTLLEVATDDPVSFPPLLSEASAAGEPSPDPSEETAPAGMV